MVNRAAGGSGVLAMKGTDGVIRGLIRRVRHKIEKGARLELTPFEGFLLYEIVKKGYCHPLLKPLLGNLKINIELEGNIFVMSII